jgi:ferrous iron transport protein A
MYRVAMSASKSSRPLSHARKGDRGVVSQVHATGEHGHDLERRLLEMGFVEGANVEVLHEGLIGRDPIAVRVDDMRVALRRREAGFISIEPQAA